MHQDSRRVVPTLLALSAALSVLGQDSSAPQVASGIYRGRWVTYKVVNGKKIFEGDILLDRVDQQAGLGTPQADLGVAYPASLWLKVGSVYQVPYTITSGGTNVTSSITAFNSTFSGIIQWAPHTSETDWVDFNLDVNDHSQTCNSFVDGLVGSRKSAVLSTAATCFMRWAMPSDCGTCSRVRIATPTSQSTIPTSSQLSRLTSIRSLITRSRWVSTTTARSMQYFAYAFTKNGQPTIESIPPGIPLSSPLLAYSAGDVDQ